MEKVQIEDNNGKKGWVLDFVFNNDKGVLAVIARKNGLIDTLPISDIKIVLKVTK